MKKMEGRSSSRLNPESPLFIPSSFQHNNNPYYFSTQQYPFPVPAPAPPFITSPNFPQPPLTLPPTFPAYTPPLYRRYYDHTHYSFPPPQIVNTHLHNIPLSVPEQLIHKPTAGPPPPPPPHEPLTDSVRQAKTPVTSGPRFRSKGIGPRGWNKKLMIQPENKQNNDEKLRPNGAGRNIKEKTIHDGNSKAAQKIVEKFTGERKSGGRNKFVRATKKAGDKEEVIPLREDEEKTTIMIKNIPNEFTREMLLQLLDQHCNIENERAKEMILEGKDMVSAYDFVYLPIDFWTRYNKGYAFVNFTNPKAVWKFYEAFNETSWDLFKSKKIIDIVSAMIQGKEGLLSHFGSSVFFCKTDEYLPLWLDPPSDGSGQPVNLHTVGKRHSPTLPKRMAGRIQQRTTVDRVLPT